MPPWTEEIVFNPFLAEGVPGEEENRVPKPEHKKKVPLRGKGVNYANVTSNSFYTDALLFTYEDCLACGRQIYENTYIL